MKYQNKEGFCPNCGSGELWYGAIEVQGGMLFYPYRCETCGQKGEEWYNMEFSGHNIITEDGDTIELGGV